jgi:hypothetical protein
MGAAQGKKVAATALRLRRSRRSRSSARTSHQRGKERRVLSNNRGRKWRVSVRLGKRSDRFGVGKEAVGGKSGFVSAKSQPQAQGSSIVSMRWGWKSTQIYRRAPRSPGYLSLKIDDPAFQMAVRSICKAMRFSKGYTLL